MNALAKEIGPDHAKLEMREDYYSEEELAKKMPLQLCDAWGLTREVWPRIKQEIRSVQRHTHSSFIRRMVLLLD